jgi:thioredoxin-dependent peroxiredoxin
MTFPLKTLLACIAVVPLVASTALAADGMRPKAGAEAPDFELKNLAGETVKLSETTAKGPVVLIVLRGFPGYQCPVCNKQVGQFIAAADKLKAKKANVLLVYPGPSKELQQRAEEFVSGKTLPDNVQLLIDPDYSFTTKYDLRWDARNETAYPSTFVLDKSRKVLFAKISDSHAGRANVDEVMKALP